MRILLIRHGETIHNVSGIYAGITDSPLTNHGVLQAQRLATHLSATETEITHIFSSDLQRAFRTAEAIREKQDKGLEETKKSVLLREQDFGFYEGKSFFERPKEGNQTGKEVHHEAHKNDPGFKDVESKESMRARAEQFVTGHLLELIHKVEDSHTVAIVAHGIILTYLWKVILRLFQPGNVSVTSSVQNSASGFSLEYLGQWSNTGYLDLEVRPKPAIPTASLPANVALAEASLAQKPESSTSLSEAENATTTDVTTRSRSTTAPPIPPQNLIAQPPSSQPTANLQAPLPQILNHTLLVKAINSKEHLVGIKKTRGGIGSLKHDSRQKSISSFFKKRRTE